jgi:hypothetical protein
MGIEDDGFINDLKHCSGDIFEFRHFCSDSFILIGGRKTFQHPTDLINDKKISSDRQRMW